MVSTELREELMEHVVEVGEDEAIASAFPLIFRHPLIVVYPYFGSSSEIEMIHRAIDSKNELINKAMSERKLSSIVWLHERAYRLEAFLEYTLKLKIKNRDYVSDPRLMVDLWVDSEGVWVNLIMWDNIWRLHSNQFGIGVMSDSEIKAYEDLPDSVVVYRGADSRNKESLAWTTDVERAEWFSRRLKLEGEEAIVYSMEVDKEDILAYLLSRGESEVVLPLSVVRKNEIKIHNRYEI